MRYLRCDLRYFLSFVSTRTIKGGSVTSEADIKVRLASRMQALRVELELEHHHELIFSGFSSILKQVFMIDYAFYACIAYYSLNVNLKKN